MKAYVIPFEQLAMRDVETVGGKNASLGEMIGSLARLGVQVPGGFATTAHAYREFLQQGGLAARISRELTKLDVVQYYLSVASGAVAASAIGRACSNALSMARRNRRSTRSARRRIVLSG